MGGCIGRIPEVKTVVLGRNRMMRVSQAPVSKGDTEGVNELSTREFCNFEADLVRSKTAERALKVIGKQINRGKELSLQINIDQILSLYRAVFVKGFPITDTERKYLWDFFSRKDILTIGNTLLADISLLQANINKEFIRRFLEDESGDYEGTKFIGYVLQELENYPFVVNIDLVGGENIEHLDSIEGMGELYFYTDSVGAYRIFLIKKDKKIIYYGESFEQAPKILKNGLVLGVKERGIRDDKGNSISAIMRAFENNGHPFYSGVGTLYGFDSKTNQLEQIYSKGGIVSVEELDHEYGFFQTTSESGKKGVVKIVETETDEWKVSEILHELYDKIYMGPDGFIVTEREDEEIQENSEVKKEMIIGIHAESWDDSAYPEDKLTGKTLLGEQGVLWDLPWSQVADYSGFNRVKFYDSTNICSVGTVKGQNCYILNKTRQSITPIDGLQRLDGTINNDFLAGIPSLVREDGKTFVKVFDRETNTARNLIEIRSTICPVLEMDGNIVGLTFNGIEEDSIEEESFYFHEGKLYDLKKGFKLRTYEHDIYKVRCWGILSPIHLGFSIYDDFEKVSEFLEEVQTPMILSV
ncbi:MAG: hypothetical protein PHN60_02630 [Candidatus Gracilibacteria bacterium]|nr:hypothetical protein [Candidatus Gracilibacteria bacterium]